MAADASKVLVIGASGFLGRHVSRALLAAGQHVRCTARDSARIRDLAAAGCETTRADISDYLSIEHALESVDAVYICVHTLSPQPDGAPHEGFMDVEKSGLQNIVKACAVQGTRRLVYVTSLGVARDARSAWLRGRWQAAQLLLNSGLDVTVIQSGQMIGVGAQGFDLLVGQAKRPVAFGLGDGRQKSRSIGIDDLTYYLTGVLAEPRTYGQCYDVGSDDILTDDEKIDVIADLLGRRHPAKVHIPLGLIAPFAPLAGRLTKLPPGAVKGLLDSLRADMTGDPAPIRAILPRTPRAFREAAQVALNHEEVAANG